MTSTPGGSGQNRAAAARKLYQDRLNANPADVDSMEALADIAFQQNDEAGALRLLGQAEKLMPTSPRFGLRVVAIFEAEKKWPDAIARTQALQAKFGKDASVQDALGHLYFESGNLGATHPNSQQSISRHTSTGRFGTEHARKHA